MTIAPPRLPRSEWPTHPHFPRQTLLLGGHESFRRTSRVLIDQAVSGRSPDALGWLFRAWKAAMHSHERYEEHKLYPYLEARWDLSMAPARVGHDQLAERERDVFAALDGSDASAIEAAFRAHDAVLCPHLDLEEELVIPALLALSPAEFEDYIHSDIRGLLQRIQLVTVG
jgi:hypothetical protein